MPAESPIAKLSPRQAECLTLVYQRKTSKQIGALLKLEPSTVDSYVSDATRLLGASDRRDAAERYVASLAQPPESLEPQSSGGEPDPSSAAVEVPPAPAVLRLPMPLRPKGSANNDLSSAQRLLFIVGLAIGFAVALGMLGQVLHSLGEWIGVFRYR